MVYFFQYFWQVPTSAICLFRIFMCKLIYSDILYTSMSVCVCAHARAHVCVCVCVCVI